MLHIACSCDGVQTENYFSRLIEGQPVSRHNFNDADELLTLAQRFSLELVFIGSTRSDDESILRLLDLVRHIKDHTFLSKRSRGVLFREGTGPSGQDEVNHDDPANGPRFID